MPVGLEVEAPCLVAAFERAGGGGVPGVAFGEAEGPGAVAVFERGLEVGVVAGGDGAFCVGVEVAALEFGLVGGVLAGGWPVAVVEGLLGGIDLWALGGVLARSLVERSCVAAVAPVAGDLGVPVRCGRLVFGARDLASGVVDGSRFGRVALEGGTELVGFLA